MIVYKAGTTTTKRRHKGNVISSGVFWGGGADLHLGPSVTIPSASGVSFVEVFLLV